MANTQLFESEWQYLQNRKRETAEKISELKKLCSSFLDLHEIQTLIAEKATVLRIIEDIKSIVNNLKYEIKRYGYWIDQRKRALNSYLIRKEVDRRTEERVQRLARLESLNAPSCVIENEKKMVWECIAPFEEIEEEIARCQRKVRETEEILKVKYETIGSIDSTRRSKKKTLEQSIRDTEDALRQRHKDILEWTNQDECHKQWALSCHPDFCATYGIDKNTGTALVSTGKMSSPTIRKRDIALALKPESSPEQSKKIWHFFITFDDNNKGAPLSADRDEFIREINPILSSIGFHELNSRLLYEKLMETVCKSVNQRQKMNQIQGNGMFHGWKKLKLTRQHRILLKFDEQAYTVYLSPQKHDIYQKIWRS